MIGRRFFTAAAALFTSTGVTATDDPWALREGFYLAPLYSVMQVDDQRLTDDGDGYALAAGYRWDFMSLELRHEALVLPRRDRQGEAELAGFSLGVQVAPFDGVRLLNNLYGAFGFGISERTNHPRFTRNDSTNPIEVGVGYLIPFEVARFGLAVRLEWLYRLDVQSPPVPEGAPQKFEDYVFRAGLQGRFAGRKPPPAPPAPPPPPPKPPIVDTDGDGVIDERDNCPETPLDSLVDNRGCVPKPAGPVTLATAQAGDMVVLHGVNFEFNRAELTVNAKALLDDVARQLDARPDLKVEIGGHTDGRGSDTYNLRLSEQRARSVLAYLAEQGIAAARLTAVGYGETQPVDTNDTDEGREGNRRVQLKILE